MLPGPYSLMCLLGQAHCYVFMIKIYTAVELPSQWTTTRALTCCVGTRDYYLDTRNLKTKPIHS